MSTRRLDPTVCAQVLAERAEETVPPDWTTDEIATFWHELANEVVLRLVRLKPEMVIRMRPEDRGR